MNVQIFSTLGLMEMKQWILAARKHAQLTQSQLGEALNITKGNVSAWENGHHEASLDQLVRIASITGYKEPFPGTGSTFVLAEPNAEHQVSKKWPFIEIDEQKVRSLSDSALTKLETALLITAAQVGLDIKKT